MTAVDLYLPVAGIAVHHNLKGDKQSWIFGMIPNC